MGDEIEDVTGSMENIRLEEKERIIKTNLGGQVGFDSLPQQINQKALKRGFEFNLLVAGASGTGKSTFVNTLFSAHLVDNKAAKSASDPPRQTVDIETVTHLIEENGVKLTLTIIDTPGFGDQINNENAWDPIVRYITDQYALYSKEESSIDRSRHIRDRRVHAVLYFIQPNGHGLKPLDIQAMRAISAVANLIPVISKSDSLTQDERRAFKKKIVSDLAQNEIVPYPASSDNEYDDAERAANQAFLNMIPFAIVGSERTVVISGKAVRGRRMGYGIINVDDPEHCEFTPLRDFLIRSHMQDLLDVTRFKHYEEYRTQQLKEKRDKKEKKKVEKSTSTKARV